MHVDSLAFSLSGSWRPGRAPGADLPPCPYCSRTRQATDDQTEETEKLHQQHLQQQRGQRRQQRRQQEEDGGRQPESVQSGTCKSRFPRRLRFPPLPSPNSGGRGAQKRLLAAETFWTGGQEVGWGKGKADTGLGRKGEGLCPETSPCKLGPRKQFAESVLQRGRNENAVRVADRGYVT